MMLKLSAKQQRERAHNNVASEVLGDVTSSLLSPGWEAQQVVFRNRMFWTYLCFLLGGLAGTHGTRWNNRVE
jgi:hypothetical protein